MEPPNLGNDGFLIRDSGEWAKDKLYYLERYLDIFSVGMKNKWAGKLYYVDLFSGPGRCHIRETHTEVDGSPLRALKFDFTEYFFFEADPACSAALEKRIKVYSPDKSGVTHVIKGDCNDRIGEVRSDATSLGLAFVDPTGISQLSFETIRKLTQNRKIDLIINFPEGMGIRMNIHQYKENERTALNRFMGSSRWQQRYTSDGLSFDAACRAIAQEYLENLRSLGYIALDSWIPVKTTQNTLLYYLLFASKDARGTDFWKKIKRIGPSGQRELNYDYKNQRL